jgi:hypothetical protein
VYQFRSMYKRKIAWIVLAVLAIVIKIFSLFPTLVEKYYSTGVYPYLTRALRALLGWVPFSIGDCLYALAALYLLIQGCRLIKYLIVKKPGKQFWWNTSCRTGFVCLVLYILFNLLWGLNYNRLGISHQLGIELKPYTTQELTTVLEVVVNKLNENSVNAMSKEALKDTLLTNCVQAYVMAEKQWPWMAYGSSSLKFSLFGIVGNYLGYSGYYNPFTGEAQVNRTIPGFIQPFTTCHEIGHQLGYAKENEANFAGYLSAKNSDNSFIRYSLYFELYQYGLYELRLRDSTAAKLLKSKITERVQADVKTLRAFNNQYKNGIEPIVKNIYGQYLMANEQPTGMHSYNEVIAFLVGYYKKMGENAL